MDKPFFNLHFPSTFDAMASAMNQAITALFEHEQIGREEEPWVRLCLEEALVNAIRHGNRCEARRNVGIEMQDAGETCTIHVYDEGNGFSPESINMPDCDQLGGRGVCLIRHFMDRVRYDCVKHRLEMSFQRRSCCKEGAHHG